MTAAGESVHPAPGRLERLRQGLHRTREGILGRITALFSNDGVGAAGDWCDELETALLQADLGPQAAARIVAGVRVATAGLTPSWQVVRDAARGAMKEILAGQTSRAEPPPARPRVTLVVGVNGGGKTTSAGKLARRLTREGKRVMLCAADTFRAAAGEQLRLWAERSGSEFVGTQPGADPSAVVFDAASAAAARGCDVLIIDTAGRLHTKDPLMRELEKMVRVVGRCIEGAPHEVLLVLDATTGQNGVAQAREFLAAAKVTGVVLTKLDGTAKGGVALRIVEELGIPLRYVGVGEGAEDLVAFDADEFLEGLLPAAA
jgi:fused signal recognition particle receptor